MFSQVKNVVHRVSHVLGVNEENKPQPDFESFGRLTAPIIYERPFFLNLSKEDEVKILNHKDRTPVVPKDASVLPFDSGYCEIVNAGKSILNEDCAVALTVILDSAIKQNSENSSTFSNIQTNSTPFNVNGSETKDIKDKSKSADKIVNKKSDKPLFSSFSPKSASKFMHRHSLRKSPTTPHTDEAIKSNVNKDDLTNNKPRSTTAISRYKERSSTWITYSADSVEPFSKNLRIDYFAIFDGHAGEGAAQYASAVLHEIFVERLREIQHLLNDNDSLNTTIPDSLLEQSSTSFGSATPYLSDSLIIGLLQDVLLVTDNHLKTDQEKFKVTGGCTVIVAVFLLGKLFVAGAGDSRAILCRSVPHSCTTLLNTQNFNGEERKIVALPMSQDFTPVTERRRLQYLAFVKPSLLSGYFRRIEFVRRVTSADIGKKVLCRDYHMTGWVYKEVTNEDLKHPMIFGVGKARRLLATIGVTRGLGDHTLIALNQLHDVPIKPFLSAVPEVRVFDLMTSAVNVNDVLVMGSDGLWDVLSNDDVAKHVISLLKHTDEDDGERYVKAARHLAATARGTLLNGTWRMSDGVRLASMDDISVFVIPLAIAKKVHCL